MASRIPPFPDDIDRYFGGFVSGFTASKGHFVLGNTMVGEQEVPTAQFMIAVRSDDEEVLDEIRSYFGVGTIYRRPEGGFDWKGELIKPMSIYCVDDINDLRDVIVPHFETFLPIGMQDKFTVWREAVES
jgi:hypothetical protein